MSPEEYYHSCQNESSRHKKTCAKQGCSVLGIYTEVNRIIFRFIFGVLKLCLILPHEIIGEKRVANQEQNDQDANEAVYCLPLVLEEFQTL
jgi:hypothetical protein